MNTQHDEPSLDARRLGIELGKLRASGKPFTPAAIYRYAREGMPTRYLGKVMHFRLSEVLRYFDSKKRGIFV